MLEVSRRNFLKATALSAVCLSGLNASFLEFSQAKQVKYFIKDSEIPHQGNFINADEICRRKNKMSQKKNKMSYFCDKLSFFQP